MLLSLQIFCMPCWGVTVHMHFSNHTVKNVTYIVRFSGFAIFHLVPNLFQFPLQCPMSLTIIFSSNIWGAPHVSQMACEFISRDSSAAIVGNENEKTIWCHRIFESSRILGYWTSNFEHSRVLEQEKTNWSFSSRNLFFNSNSQMVVNIFVVCFSVACVSVSGISFFPKA